MYMIMVSFMPLFHQRIKPRSCRRPLIVGSLGKNGKKIDQWGGRQNRYEGLGLTTDRPQDAPGGPRQSLSGLGLRTDQAIFVVGLNHDPVVDKPTGSQDASGLLGLRAD